MRFLSTLRYGHWLLHTESDLLHRLDTCEYNVNRPRQLSFPRPRYVLR
jgi:hypothetical protein